MRTRGGGCVRSTGRTTAILAPIYRKLISLPRQARDKCRESTQKKRRFLTATSPSEACSRSSTRSSSRCANRPLLSQSVAFNAKTPSFYQDRLGTKPEKTPKERCVLWQADLEPPRGYDRDYVHELDEKAHVRRNQKEKKSCFWLAFSRACPEPVLANHPHI